MRTIREIIKDLDDASYGSLCYERIIWDDARDSSPRFFEEQEAVAGEKREHCRKLQEELESHPEYPAYRDAEEQYKLEQHKKEKERTKRLRRKLINRYQQSSSALPPQS